MYYDDDDYGENAGFKTTAILVSVILVVSTIILVVALNSDSFKKKSTEASASVTVSSVSVSTEEEYFHSSSSLTPQDLDFYEMYPQSLEEEETSVEEKTETEEVDESKDGNHTLIKYKDGSEEWVPISRYITKHNYDLTNITDQDGIKEYSHNGITVSSFGVDISKDQDYVDFVKLYKAGVDFVMLRVGARGYQSGELSIDDYFEDNLRRATSAGLEVGVYFLSQAVTKEEAVEEANLVIEKTEGYKLVYPVAFVMEYVDGESSRVEALTKTEKTDITREFLKTIDEAGYKAIEYGTKEWLIKNIELNKVAADFDIWLSEEEDLPSFPYAFTMWQYNKSGSIPGIKGPVSFDLCLVDYSLR